MDQPRTGRKFEERFLDGFDRSKLREEVQKVPRARGFGSKLKRKYATYALGASLALGGAAIPMQVTRMLEGTRGPRTATPPGPDADTSDARKAISGDLNLAKQIAAQVQSGVTSAAGEVAQLPAGGPAATPATLATQPQAQEAAPLVPRKASDAAEATFFQKEIPFGGIIYQEAKKNDLPPALVAAVVHTESKFIPTARSHAGAIGLMQLVPRTGRWMGAHDLTNPVQNIQAGAKYLKYLTDRFDGDQQKAVAAYNAGEGNVRRFNGVPPFEETRNYVTRVSSYAHDIGQRLEGQVSELGQ